MADQTDKHPGGRPLPFETLEELQHAIRAYFGEQNPHVATRKKRRMADDGTYFWTDEEYMTEQKPLTMAGLARALGIDRRTLKNYADRDEFFPAIDQARARCEEYAEQQLFIGNANGAKFNLSNNYDDWRDKSTVDGEQKLIIETRKYDDNDQD
jgi:hypothetical protein